MSYNAIEKGVAFENRIAGELTNHRIEFRRQYKVKGLGKSWRIDFFLYNTQQHLTLLECKNVGRNLLHSLIAESVKFLDIRNLEDKYRFMLVFPKVSKSMNTFSKFCTVYDIRLATADNFIHSLYMDIHEQNKSFALSEKQREEGQRTKMILEFLQNQDGLNQTEISIKIGIGVTLCYASLRKLEREGLVIGVRKKHQDKHWYIKTTDLQSYLHPPICSQKA